MEVTKQLIGLTRDDFRHPADIARTQILEKVPGLEVAMRKVNELHYERVLYIQNLGNCVHITPTQGGKLYRLLQRVCQTLDYPLPGPALFVWQYPVANMYSYGTESPFIVLTSGLLDLLQEEEVHAALAHEMGHIICGHVVYQMVGNLAVRAGSLGIPALFTEAFNLAFQEWEQKSDLSADRAALLAIQNIKTVTNTLMKLSGGHSILGEELNLGEFLRQANDFESQMVTGINKAYKFVLTRNLDHPFPTTRAKELLDWHRSEDYKKLVKQDVQEDLELDVE